MEIIQHILCTLVCIDLFILYACTYVCIFVCWPPDHSCYKASASKAYSSKSFVEPPFFSSSLKRREFLRALCVEKAKILIFTVALANFLSLPPRVCINTDVCMRMHICGFICTGMFFAVQVIKTGKGFCVFLIGEEILKTRDWNILNFKLKKKKKVKLSGCGRWSLIFAATLNHEFISKCAGFFVFVLFCFLVFIFLKS